MLDHFASLPPSRSAEGEERVERVSGEDWTALKFRGAKMPAFFEDREIQNEITDGDAYPRRAGRGFENSERQILD